MLRAPTNPRYSTSQPRICGVSEMRLLLSDSWILGKNFAMYVAAIDSIPGKILVIRELIQTRTVQFLSQLHLVSMMHINKKDFRLLSSFIADWKRLLIADSGMRYMSVANA